MKIAVSGKGGVGKSTITAALANLISQKGKRVLAVDADPDANLGSALGITSLEQEKIVTIAEQKELIEERTGAKINQYGQIFKLNPEVSDIASKYAYNINNISLLVLGAVNKGGAGCACPENTLLKSLIQDLVLYKDEILILDMEAGIEHLGRATATGIDTLIIVTEPGQRSIDSVKRIHRMGNDIGIRDIRIIANKVRSTEEEEYIKSSLKDQTFLGSIPYSESLIASDRDGNSVMDGMETSLKKIFISIIDNL